MKASKACKKSHGKGCELKLQKTAAKPARSKKTGRFIKKKK